MTVGEDVRDAGHRRRPPLERLRVIPPARPHQPREADDQELMREGLAMILGAQADLEVVGQAADGEEAVRLAAEALPDVVLIGPRRRGQRLPARGRAPWLPGPGRAVRVRR